MALDALRGVAQGIAGRAFKKVAGNMVLYYQNHKVKKVVSFI